jgi:membrane protease YdiL (CAAX protease family)
MELIKESSRLTRHAILPMLLLFVGNWVTLNVLLRLPPGWAFLAMPAIIVGCYWFYRGDSGNARRRRATVRLRAPRGNPLTIAAVIVSSIMVGIGMTGIVAGFVSRADLTAVRTQWEPLLSYTKTIWGLIALFVAAGFVLPIAEEFVVRGHVQRALERRWGVASAIVATSSLFALGHLGGRPPSAIAISFVLGLSTGTAVWLSGSIWTGVAIHILWNSTISPIVAAVISSRIDEPGSSVAWPCVLGLGVVGWVIIMSTRSGRGTRPRMATARVA